MQTQTLSLNIAFDNSIIIHKIYFAVVCHGNTPKYGSGSFDQPQVSGGGYPVGTFVAYLCDYDFKKGGTFRQICQENGQWTAHLPGCGNC